MVIDVAYTFLNAVGDKKARNQNVASNVRRTNKNKTKNNYYIRSNGFI